MSLFSSMSSRKQYSGRASGGMQGSLADTPAGATVRLAGYTTGMPAERLAQLLAYGLTPGSLVQVVQQRPVTVVRCEHTELALEAGLAREVQVVSG